MCLECMMRMNGKCCSALSTGPCLLSSSAEINTLCTCWLCPSPAMEAQLRGPVTACAAALYVADAELRMAYAGWALSGGAVMSPKEGSHREKITVMHRYHFTSALKRMAVTVKVHP